jgi:3',5'-cyclic AMP phosphodiesterase CpdA
MMKTLFKVAVAVLVALNSYGQKPAESKAINIAFISDVHYGITRKAFRGAKNVTSKEVNAALVTALNSLPSVTLPDDGGINAGNKINAVDYVIAAGDISNRMEKSVQTAAVSWAQFDTDYMHALKLTGIDGQPAKLLLVPGNHDASNAIGYPKPLSPLTDPTAMVNIYNLEMAPAKQLTTESYNYKTDKINYSRYINGVHFVLITIWADSAERVWMQKDLDTVSAATPVIIVAHDPPTCDARHFTSAAPAGASSKNKFQNLVSEHYKEDETAADNGVTDAEQRGFTAFLKAHPNIKAYFHGHNNWTEFYTYKGPDNDVNLKVFRVDSPMKGKYSSKDETLLSFELITFDRHELTVRECLWNTAPSDREQKITFGKRMTIALN